MKGRREATFDLDVYFERYMAKNMSFVDALFHALKTVVERADRHRVHEFRLLVRSAAWNDFLAWAESDNSRLKKIGEFRFCTQDKHVFSVEPKPTFDERLSRQVESARMSLSKMPAKRQSKVAMALRGMGNVAE